MKKIDLSVIIPAYNEETNIRLGALDKVLRYLQTQTYNWEVVIVNDGSTDRTKELVSEFCKHTEGFTLINNPHLGKAGTVVSGMLAGKGDILLFTDLDQATPLNQSEKILPWFTKGYDAVIGSRSGRREGAPLLRLIMARGFMILRGILLGLRGITDTQCGFKAFRNTVAKNIFGSLKVYGNRHEVSGSMVTAGFDLEVLYLAKVRGYKIKEIPVEWHYVETRRVNPIKDSWQGFMDILKIRWKAWMGEYK